MQGLPMFAGRTGLTHGTVESNRELIEAMPPFALDERVRSTLMEEFGIGVTEGEQFRRGRGGEGLGPMGSVSQGGRREAF